MSHEDFPGGSVWLVGAGPGDPELLTRKAERLLRRADIVYHDALVSAGVLDLIPHSAERVCVGKRAGRHSMGQASIDGLLVAAALSGKRVVRLKGGDPGMFARSAEELGALAAAGVRCRICPGITAASAAAASAGVALSQRGIAPRVQFVTAHRAGNSAREIDWSALADRQSTLALYMGRGAAGEIGARLRAAGLPGTTPVLIACNVSLPDERLLHTRLDLLELATATVAHDQPTLILIGDAVSPRRSLIAVPTKIEAGLDQN